MRHRCYAILGAACAIITIAATSHANIIVPVQSALRGTTGSGLTTSAPGTSFSFDYRPLITRDTAPYEPASLTFIFEASQAPFSELKVRLDSSPAPFTFFPYTGNGYQLLYVLYDPKYELTPGSPWPANPAYMVMPDVWRDDLSDGVLSGSFWVTNPAGTPNTYIFSTQALFVVPDAAAPEPSAAFGVIVSAAALLGRTRRRPR